MYAVRIVQHIEVISMLLKRIFDIFSHDNNNRKENLVYW